MPYNANWNPLFQATEDVTQSLFACAINHGTRKYNVGYNRDYFSDD